MSSINLAELRSIHLISSQQHAARIQAKKDELEQKCVSLDAVLMNPNDPRSLYSAVKRAAKYADKDGKKEFFINFDRDMFCKWNRFVPFKPDANGFNYNARPASCLKLYLDRCKAKEMLPPGLTYDVWGNRKFTVKFYLDLHANETDKEAQDVSDHAEGDQVIRIVRKVVTEVLAGVAAADSSPKSQTGID